jgi:ABC-type molybdate transport system permease subunit
VADVPAGDVPGALAGLLTGFALAFARGLGEYGSVVFVSGNMPFKTEIAAFLIVSRLEEGRPNSYARGDGHRDVLLLASFLMLVSSTGWKRGRASGAGDGTQPTRRAARRADPLWVRSPSPRSRCWR